MSTVMHKKTLEVIRYANTPDYDPNTWLVNPDLSKVEGVPKKFWTVRGDEVVPITEAARKKIEESEIDGLKEERFREFEDNTVEALRVGFEYPAGSGRKISLSDTDRITLLAMADGKTPAELFPFTIIGLNGRESTLNNSEDVKVLVKTDIAFRLSTKKAEMDLKRRVREAQTIEAVNFVADRRV